MSDAGFVHLHTHSHYTLLESPVTIGALIGAAKEQGSPAIAITDRGNLFGALEFMEGCKRAEIAGIVGCQVNIAPLGMTEKTPDMLQLVLLATSERGYFNLTRLVSLGWLEGFYYEPRVDLDCLRTHAEDLICLTGAGPDGFLNRHLLAGASEEADRQAGLLKDIFGDRLYVELTAHGDDGGPTGTRTMLTELAKRCELPVVATNWSHYLAPTDADVHDVQLAVQKATTLDDPRRKRMDSQEYALKTPAEMAALFADQPEAIANTLVIAEACAACHIPTGTYHLPDFECPPDLDTSVYLARFDDDEYQLRYIVDARGKERNLSPADIDKKIASDALLDQLCRAGMVDRYGDDVPQDAPERLEFEIATITRMGFSAYFLIVSDFINWAKDQDIPVGPGRGSAAGSLVAYALGITDLCPMRYGLLFERFLNPDRISMPDIDIDFCKDRRGEVIEYTAQKYGRQAVTQIMTLGTMKARMAIKDVARAYSWTPEEAQEMANLVPEDPSGKHTIPVCLGLKELKGGGLDPSEGMVMRYQRDPRSKDMLDTAMALENLGRSLGVHACGVIIAPGPVHEFVPVCTVKHKPATQYNMVQVEDCGLLKMDFLGLKTMSILKKAADIAQAVSGVTIDYPNLPLDDEATFALLGEGDTLGVFQCESSGFRELIRLLQPDRFEDMIALVALYRPGPLQAGMHTSYCNRKHGREEVEYPSPVLQSILEETFGLYIYQEQVMNISRELCGFTPGEADTLRKAMGKKKLDVLEKLKAKFVDGAYDNHRFPRDKCEAMWENILGFASYCFNKSHSACYGLIAYWTAYMKANHFEAFMTANLIYEMGNKDKMTMFVQELRRRRVQVLPPDINESGWEFTWTGEAVRFGFGGIKGVGEGAAAHLIEVRDNGGTYETLYDVCERIDTRTVNKRVIEHLAKVGALDSLHANRHALVDTIDRAFNRAHRVQKTKAQSQMSLFGDFEQDDEFRAATQGYSDAEDWQESERLAYEKALTGYWMSSHPLVEHQERLGPYATHTSRELAERPRGQLTLAAVVVGKRDIKTRTGKRMAVLQLEDMHGGFEAVLFPGRNNRRGEFEPGAYERFAAECEEDMVCLVTGKVDDRDKNKGPTPAPAAGDDDDDDIAAPAEEREEQPDRLPSLLVSDMVPAHLLEERLTREITVEIDAAEGNIPERLAKTEALVKDHTGPCPLRFLVQTDVDILLTVSVGDRWRVHPTRDLINGLRELWGADAVVIASDVGSVSEAGR